MKLGTGKSTSAAQRRGSTLAMSMFIVVLASLSTVWFASTALEHQRQNKRKRDRNVAFHAAEAGVRAVLNWTNDQTKFTLDPDLFTFVDKDEYFQETGFISAKDGTLEKQYPNLHAKLQNGPLVIDHEMLAQMGLGSMKGTKGKYEETGIDTEVATLNMIVLDIPDGGAPNVDGLDVYAIGESHSGQQRIVYAGLVLFPNLNVALGGALISMAGAGLGGNAQVHWGESWARGNITNLPSETNLGHLDEKASGNNAYDKWARYRSEGQIAGVGMALSYLGGTGSWASRWSSTVPNNFNPGNAPLLYAGTGADVDQPGWFPGGNTPQVNPPIISPDNMDAQNQQPGPNLTDGRMTNAFFQNEPADSLLFPDFLHQHRSSQDFKTYNIFKKFAIQTGNYYYSTAGGDILDQSGNVVDFSTFQQNGAPEAQLYFVDTIDGNPPAVDGSNLGNIKIAGKSDGYAGLFYLCANVELTGTGNTQYGPSVKKPDGTTNLSSSESQDLGKVWLNGALFTAGSLSVAGNPVVYGSVITEKGVTGSGSMDIYYNIDIRNGLNVQGDKLPERFTILRQNNLVSKEDLPSEIQSLL